MLVTYSNDLNELALNLGVHKKRIRPFLHSHEIRTGYHGQISTSFIGLRYLRENVVSLLEERISSRRKKWSLS